MNMLGKEPGWYAGHWVGDEEGIVLGGDIFLPNTNGYLGNEAQKPEPVPDFPWDAQVYWWTGQALLLTSATNEQSEE